MAVPRKSDRLAPTRRSRWRRPWIRSLVFGGAVVLLTIHAGLCAAVIALLPRGFPLDDVHMWSNVLLPAAMLVVIIGALVRFVFFKSSGITISCVVAAVTGGWVGAILTGAILFPVSLGFERIIGPIAIAISLGVLAWMMRIRRTLSAGAAVAGIALGVVEMLGQRAPPPSTRPRGGTLAEVKGEPTKDDAASGQVSFPCGKEHVRVRPLLTFESRSPDGSWTVLAPPESFGPRRRFDGFVREQNGFRAHYTDDGESSLFAMKDSKGLDIEAYSRLSQTVFSHLNAFTLIHVPFESVARFSPTETTDFAIESTEPVTFGYLGADMFFHVVRATEAEKGPYTEVAKGHLNRDEPFVIDIRHSNKAGGSAAGTCKLTFKDWTNQVSTDLSPTAGWGVPQNSVQFFSRGSEGFIVLTLAETGPGRGWHSVGHTEGTYRNRIRVDTVMDVPAAPPAKK